MKARKLRKKITATQFKAIADSVRVGLISPNEARKKLNPEMASLTSMALAPRFSWSDGQPVLATIYGSHYDRMRAVIDAARTGNSDLIKLALKHHDAFGSNDEPEARAPEAVS